MTVVSSPTLPASNGLTWIVVVSEGSVSRLRRAEGSVERIHWRNETSASGSARVGVGRQAARRMRGRSTLEMKTRTCSHGSPQVVAAGPGKVHFAKSFCRKAFHAYTGAISAVCNPPPGSETFVEAPRRPVVLLAQRA